METMDQSMDQSIDFFLGSGSSDRIYGIHEFLWIPWIFYGFHGFCGFYKLIHEYNYGIHGNFYRIHGFRGIYVFSWNPWIFLDSIKISGNFESLNVPNEMK